MGLEKGRPTRWAGHPDCGAFARPDEGLGLCLSDQEKPPSCHLGRAGRGIEAREIRVAIIQGTERGLAVGVWRRESVSEMSPRWHRRGCVMDWLWGVGPREGLTIQLQSPDRHPGNKNEVDESG